VKPDNGQIDLPRLRSADAPELHRAIGAVKQQLPDPQQLAALAASLSQMGISVAPSGPATAATPPSATRLKLLIGAGVVGPIALALLLWRSASPPATAPIASAPAAIAQIAESPDESGVRSNAASERSTGAGARDSAVPSPSSSASEVATTDNRAQPVASAEASKSVPRVVAAPTAPSVRPAVAPDARSPSPDSAVPSVVARPTEVALLRDARLALNGSPSAALGLAEQHRALYPRGAMVQERELIAISALARLGRHSAVLARAAQFERDFPTSPYRKQVNALAQ